jgi:F0F1-type ATP synthase assembly protein I
LQNFFVFSSGFSLALLLVFAQLVEPGVLAIVGAGKFVFPEILFVFVAFCHSNYLTIGIFGKGVGLYRT